VDGEKRPAIFDLSAVGAELFAFLAQPVKCFLAVHGLNQAAFELIVSAIEGLANLGQFRALPSYSVLNQLIFGTATGSRQLFQLSFEIGGKMHFHNR